MSVSENICRLCMNTEAMTNLFRVDGDTTLDQKIRDCIDLKISTGDGLPAVICKMCENKVNIFYEFKLNCLFVDSKLRDILVPNCLYSPYKLKSNDTDQDNIKKEIKLECHNIISKMSNDLQQSFNSWLTDNEDSELYEEYLRNQNPVRVENEPPSGQLNHQGSNDKKIHVKKQSSTFKKSEIVQQKIYQCEICGRILKNKSILVKHIASHSGIKQFACKLCSKTFSRSEHKVTHMRIHLGVKPYICEICGKSFTKRQDLIRHMRIHSDERNYSCPRCDRKFKRSGDVHSHMRTHTGAKPYSCTLCDKIYTSHSGLRKHHKKHIKKETTIIN